MAKAKTTSKASHPITELLTRFDEGHRRRFGKPYRVIKGKDPKTAKDLLDTYELADLCRWSDAFFESFDRFIRDSTYGFGVFASCIGKLIAAENPGPHIKPKTLRTMQGIHGD